MEEFKPITTQEEFDSMLAERLAQKERSVSKKFEGFTSPDELKKIKKGYDDQISELNRKVESYKDVDEKISGYEKKIAEYETDSVKTRTAIEKGIPLELIDRIRGTTKEEIEADADKLAQLVGSKITAPLGSEEVFMSREDMEKQKLDNAYKEFVKKL